MPQDQPLLSSFTSIPACQRCGNDVDWFPAVDILEGADEYLLIIDLPDVRAENIQVFVEGDGLFVSGERLGPSAADKKCLRIERPHGHFERRFALPEDVNRAGIDSAFQDGLLELQVRKIGSVLPNTPGADARPKLRLRPAA